MIRIKDWLLGKVLQGRVILFEDDGELIPINDITIDGDFMFCRYDSRDVEERFADLDE
jgi:hypothetical protein